MLYKYLATRKSADIVWINPPDSRCTTKFKLGRVTGVVSHHSVEVNGLPRYIKDLRPFQGPIPLLESETDSENQSAEDEIPITQGLIPLEDTLDNTRPETDDSLTNPSPSEDDVIIPLRRSTQQKSPTRSCTVWNSVDQPAENEIPAALEPAWLGDTLNATRRMQMTPQQMEVHQRVTLRPACSGGALDRRGSLRVAQWNEGAQDECGSLPLSMGKSA